MSTFEALLHVERLHDLKIDAAYIRDWRALVAPGGHGKTQIAVQAQYLIDRFSSVELVICAGAAGSLAPELCVGDVVVGTETVEHDYRQLFATRPLPRFPGHRPSIDALRRSAQGVGGFHVAFEVVASGDDDVVTSERAQAIRDQTGAACVGSSDSSPWLTAGSIATTIRDISGIARPSGPAQLFEQRARPQRAGHVVEDLGEQLLPAEPCAFVLLDDLIAKGGGEVLSILAVSDGRPIQPHSVRIASALSSDRLDTNARRIGRGR